MRYAYDQFIFRRTDRGRVFLVNAQMPFEYFISCFQMENPFFLVSQLDDGRVTIIPNVMCLPSNVLQTGFWPQDLLPAGYEYVTIKQGTYPVIISAHPLPSFEEWFKSFVRGVEPFATQSLATYVTASWEFLPLHVEEGKAFTPRTRKETVPV
jgi:hypothetical protein